MSTSDDIQIIIERGAKVVEAPPDLVTAYEASRVVERHFQAARVRAQGGHRAGGASRARADEIWRSALAGEAPASIDDIAQPVLEIEEADRRADVAFGILGSARSAAALAVESAARHSAEEVTFRLQGAMAKIVEEVETLRPLVADVDSTDARSVLGTDAATQRAMRKLLTLAVKYRSVRSTQASAAAVSRPPRQAQRARLLRATGAMARRAGRSDRQVASRRELRAGGPHGARRGRGAPGDRGSPARRCSYAPDQILRLGREQQRLATTSRSGGRPPAFLGRGPGSVGWRAGCRREAPACHSRDRLASRPAAGRPAAIGVPPAPVGATGSGTAQRPL